VFAGVSVSFHTSYIQDESKMHGLQESVIPPKKNGPENEWLSRLNE
jgi:hypothetical protein